MHRISAEARRTLVPLTLAVLAAAAGAETDRPVSGRVRELGSRDPVVGAVILAGDDLLGEADMRGRFTVAVPPGTVELGFRAPGFESKTVRLPETSEPLTVSLRRVEFEAAEVVVRGRRDRSEPSKSRIKRRQISRIPGTAGDALRAIQSLPGVASPGDFSGQLAVRGGDPEDNLYFLDNVPWPIPYHFDGILSTTHPDLMDRVDLHAGGFGARWGNASGAIIDATTRPGRPDRFHGNADVNLVTADLMLEGPLGLGASSWTLAGRRSYFDFIVGEIADVEFTALPRFWDLGGSLNFPLGGHDTVRLLAQGTDDILGVLVGDEESQDPDFHGEFRFRNRYATSGLSWRNTALPGFDSQLTAYTYTVNVDIAFGQGFGLDVTPRITGIKEEAEWDAGRLGGFGHRFGFGGGIEYRDVDVEGYIHRRVSGEGSGVLILSEPVRITSGSRDVGGHAYLQDRIEVLPSLAVTLGGRYDRSVRVGLNVLTPRASAEWEADPATTVNLAWGLYAQNPQPAQLHHQFGNPELEPTRTRHLVLGVERWIVPGLTGRVEAYDKRAERLVVEVPDPRAFSNEGRGSARGAELMVEYDGGERVFGWLSYAHSRARRKPVPGAGWRRHQFDQPHIGTAVLSYGILPNCFLGTKLRYSSGPLITPVIGRYQDTRGVWQPIYGASFSERLDDYLRLDSRLSYHWLLEGWKFTFYLEVLNVFDRSNPAGVTTSIENSETDQVNNLGRLYYFGLGAEF